MTQVSLLTAVALTLISASANANTIAISAPPEEPIAKRIELDIGMMIGGLDMGTTKADANGLAMNAGLRLGDLSILGEFNYLGLHATERGVLTRVGVTSRYSVVPFGSKTGFATSDLWLEGGAGWEHVAWRSGGVLDRADLALGFGGQANIVLDRKSAHPRFLGPYFAFRALVAHGPASDDPATCGGPCDRATRPPSTDVSFFLNFGINWGRLSFSD